MRKVAIVGAGHGGVQAAASLRDEGFDDEIMLISGEFDEPYHRPPLSKNFLKAGTKPHPLRSSAFYRSADITLMMGTSVAEIDLRGRALTLDDGPRLTFDRVILATGSRARRLPDEIDSLDNVASLRTLSDARRINSLAELSRSVVIVGGGFIGLEAAAALAATGRKITIIEQQDRVLARVVSPGVSGYVSERLGAAGVSILTSAVIAEFVREGNRLTAIRIASGEEITVDLAIVGIGAVPNAELASQAGLAMAGGVKVDGTMTTSAPEVLAIGDLASFPHPSIGSALRLESVQNATDQGRRAARTIMGRSGAYAEVPWFWSDIGELKLQIAGVTAGSDRQIVVGDPGGDAFSVFAFRGDVFAGAECVNRPGDYMLARRMLKAGFNPTTATIIGGIEALKDAFSSSHSSRV